MASVVKKGYLDVKRKNRIGSAYKRKFVVLRRNMMEGIKVVDIFDSESVDSEKECVQLSGMWTVQERESQSKQSKKKFAFELVIGASVIVTFSCPSLLERSEWIESFRILNSISSSSPVPPIEDMYHVILEHNISSAEIGMAGAYFLRVQDGSIVLYTEDGSCKLHHWAFENVENISMVGDQVILDVHRPGNNDGVLMQFKFNTDFDSSRNILIACSMLFGKDQKRLSSLSLNNVGISVSPAEPTGKSQSLSRSFLGNVKQSNKHGKEDKGVVRRVKSFTEKTSFGIRRSLSPDPVTIGSIHSVSSQESYAVNRPLSQSKDDEIPPPVPPRAPNRRPRSGVVDPDYSTIKDDTDGFEIRKGKNTGGNETENLLDDLLRDIEETNRKKRRQTIGGNNTISPYAETAKKSLTLTPISSSSRGFEDFDPHGTPSDYLEPVPSKTPRGSASSQSKDWSHANGTAKRFSSSSNESNSVFHSLTSSSSHHDYHTIPDKPSVTQPTHSHTSSMDSTHDFGTTVFKPQRSVARTKSNSDDPPSPPLPPRPSHLRQLPLSSSSSQSTVHSSSKVGDISPYAISRGIIMTSDSTPAPPLPPRSPKKHTRERISLPSSVPHSMNSRCQKCNGIKAGSKSKTLAATRKPHRLPPSPPMDEEKLIYKNETRTNFSLHQNQQPGSKPRPKSQLAADKENSYGYGQEIDSALAMLDDCVKDLTFLGMDIDTMETSPKSSQMSLQTDIDEAIKSVMEVGSDLQSTKMPVKRATSLHNNHFSSHQQKISLPSSTTMNSPHIPPRSEVSLTQGGTQTTPKRQLTSPHSASNLSSHGVQNGTRFNGNHHSLTRYHSLLLQSSEINPSNNVRAQDIKYK